MILSDGTGGTSGVPLDEEETAGRWGEDSGSGADTVAGACTGAPATAAAVPGLAT